MPSDKFTAFLDAVKSNPELVNQLKNLSNPSDVIAIASSLGFEITESDLNIAQSEVTPEELEGLFGGEGKSSNCNESEPYTNGWCCGATSGEALTGM